MIITARKEGKPSKKDNNFGKIENWSNKQDMIIWQQFRVKEDIGCWVKFEMTKISLASGANRNRYNLMLLIEEFTGRCLLTYLTTPQI